MAALVDINILVYRFDALMWAAAEQNGLEELVSEDFQHGQRLGRVTIVNPFAR